MIERLGRWWCQHFHGAAITKPRHEKYQCWRCLREYRVDWPVKVQERLTFDFPVDPGPRGVK